MCGLFGQVNFDGAPVDAAWQATAGELLRHRGPDGGACAPLTSAGGTTGVLGHRRLKVIDLSAAADQPMSNAGCVDAGRAAPLSIVLNGEIYNYQGLRRELIDRGHRFTSESDVEVVLHLYEEDGVGCVHHLRGMFAFALWDSARDRLFCARDRLGKKPLYYHATPATFMFASTPHALLAHPHVADDIDPEVIHSYLSFGYVAGHQSAFRALRRLDPAHSLVAERGGVTTEPYWALDFEPKATLAFEDAKSELARLLAESVRLRLTSDVPLGAFLSGGLDSSAVVATMCLESPKTVRTFSIGFDDPAYDELPAAREIAARLGTEHHELVVHPDAVESIPELAWHYGEPYADSSAVPTFCLAKFAREAVTVALNGDGGDEGLGGYRRYRAHAFSERLGILPRVVRDAAGLAARSIPGAARSRGRSYDLERFVSGVSKPAADRYVGWFGFFHEFPDILSQDLRSLSARPHQDLVDQFAQHANLDPFDAASAADLATYLPDDLLVKVDVATMAHGLEARSPLLDQELIEFAARLPVSLKSRGASQKYLLREVMKEVLPADILSKPKTGFGVPLDSWFRSDLLPMTRDLLLASDTRSRAFVDQRAVARLIDEHVARKRAHGHRLWALLMLESWQRAVLQQPRSVTPPALQL